MSLLPSLPPAILALADGTVFRGYAIGATGITSGEVVFNTAMTGYQEILTDPSYCRQIVTLTYPHIGNTGCNDEDFESRSNYAAGLVIRDLPLRAENWRKTSNLSDYLRQYGVVAIGGSIPANSRAFCVKKAPKPVASWLSKPTKPRRSLRRAPFPVSPEWISLRSSASIRLTNGTRAPGRSKAMRRPPRRLSRRRLRLRHQTQHPAHAGGARLAK